MDHEITALKAQKRNQQRVNVYLDGAYAFGVSRIVAAWLEVGQRIGDEKIAQLKSDDRREIAYQQALKFLSYRPRSEAELRQNLLSHKYPDEDITFTLKRLRQNNLLDDVRFAQVWVENRVDLHPRGIRALEYELRNKGITQDIIDQTLEGLDEQLLANAAAHQRAPRWEHLEPSDFKTKMHAYLSRRGFNYSIAREATDHAWIEIHGIEDKL